MDTGLFRWGFLDWVYKCDYIQWAMQLTVEFDKETDGRHIAQVSELPGCLVYGETRAEADMRVRVLALHILADQVEHGERDAQDIAELYFDRAA